MQESHLTLELLRAIHRHEREPGDLVPVALGHLFELCSSCREAFEAWRRELGEGVADASFAQYDAAFDRVRACLHDRTIGEAQPTAVGSEQSLLARVREEEAEAHERISELLAMSPRERPHRIRMHPERFFGPALAELLIQEARRHLPGRPGEAYAVAGLARAVLQHGRSTTYTGELYARALAHQANAVRAQGELRRADELFDVARYLLKAQGGGDRLSRAELDSFEGSLRRAQRRFDEARILLVRSVIAYSLENRPLEAARATLKLGMTYRDMGEVERAVETTADACDLIDPQDDPSLHLFARHNLASMLLEAGRTAEAKGLLMEISISDEHYGDPLTRIRRLWLDSELAYAEGDIEAAESGFHAVRESYLAHGIGFSAAMVAMDLAVLYAEQRRTMELKRLVEEIVPIFEAQDVHREAATALMLFQDAVRTERVTLGYLLELSRYLERARLDPSLTFQTPD